MKLTDPGADPEFASDRITRIVTTEFPHYFAVITRIRQEIHAIGPEGGIINSTVVPSVQAIFPEGALTKKIKVGLQVRPSDDEEQQKQEVLTSSSKEGCFPSLRKLFRPKTQELAFKKEMETSNETRVLSVAEQNSGSLSVNTNT